MFLYQADCYCDACGAAIARELEAAGVPDEGDSDGFPQSAPAGEADYPNHCAAGADCIGDAVNLEDYGLEPEAELIGAESRRIGELLEDLTDGAGRAYLRELLEADEDLTPYQVALHRYWREVFDEPYGVQDAARAAAGWFEGRTRDDGSRFVTLRDGAPEWIRDLVYEAHGDFLPEDWRYACIAAAVDAIAEDEDADAGEFADDQVDVYTSDRLRWLSSNLNRAAYCDEAAEELGHDMSREDGIVGLIGLGQYQEASEVFGLVLRGLETRVGEVI